MSANNNNHLQDSAVNDDSDSESDTDDLESSYRPISFDSDSDPDPDPDPEPDIVSRPETASITLSNGPIPNHLQNPIPNPNLNAISLSSLDLSGRTDHEAVEEEASILRAFREDENRRNAPLTVENAARVLDAMRGVSFPGTAPDWAAEDRWVDQLRRLRRGENTAAGSRR